MATWVYRRLGRFPRFLLVGASNTCISFGSYRVLLAIGTPYLVAAALAFAAGAANGYALNRRWTFDRAPGTRGARAAYVTVQAGGLASSSFLVWVLGGGLAIPPLAAYLAALPPVTVGMFLANRSWTFAPPRAMLQAAARRVDSHDIPTRVLARS